MTTWNKALLHEKILKMSGTGPLSNTLDNAAAVEVVADNNLVRIPCTGHGLKAGSMPYLSGTTNYDLMRKIAAVDTNTFDIYADYVAETFAGTETVKTIVTSKMPFELLEVKLHLSSAPTTAENFTITVDAADGSDFDFLLFSQGMAGVTDVIWSPSENLTFNPDDKLVFEWNNTDGRTFGLEVLYGVQGG